jgi:hypothetical protein
MLLKPLPGDLADRQTIVELKVNHCNAEFDQDQAQPQGKMLGMTRTLVNKNSVNAAPFLDELEMLRNELSKKWVPSLVSLNRVEAYDKLYDQLAETNGELWELEDKIRALKAAPYQKEQPWLIRVMETAFDIVTQNDKRSELIKAINKLWNYNTQEKMY